MSGPAPTPTAVRVSPDRQTLRLVLADGSERDYTAEYLRVESPSAEVRGHGAADRQIVSGKRGVRIALVEAVGAYAIRIGFDDGHDTGLYSWGYLDTLAREHARIWDEYIKALAVRGLSR